MAGRNAAPSLTDFASSQPNSKAKCRVCLLPPDVLAQVRASVGVLESTVVVKWLNEHHGTSLNPNGAQVRTCNKQHAR